MAVDATLPWSEACQCGSLSAECPAVGCTMGGGEEKALSNFITLLRGTCRTSAHGGHHNSVRIVPPKHIGATPGRGMGKGQGGRGWGGNRVLPYHKPRADRCHHRLGLTTIANRVVQRCDELQRRNNANQAHGWMQVCVGMGVDGGRLRPGVNRTHCRSRRFKALGQH